MRQSSDAVVAVGDDADVSFVSSNAHKYKEASALLSGTGIRVRHIRSELQEIQSDSLCDVARAKAHDAYSKFGIPVLVEDDGLFIDALEGFPGPYSSHAYKTIGIRGILRLLDGCTGRGARFAAAVSYDDGKTHRTFEAAIYGIISEEPRGDGWGYDPVFVPCIAGCDNGSDAGTKERSHTQTFAEMDAGQKIKTSHRTAALCRFADWYLAEIKHA